MTDEDRQKLCAELYAFDRPAIPKEWIRTRGKLAAREIERLAARVKSLETVAELNLQEGERLAAELTNANRLLEIGRRRSLEKSGGLEIKQSVAQPDAEPVAWRWRNKGTSTWQYVEPDVGLPDPVPTRHLEVEPLFTAPPRPDTSAGLIEAAEIAHAKAMRLKHPISSSELFELEDELRTLAADRSAK